MTWDKAVSGYVQWARAAGLSQHTIWLRSYYLRILAAAFADHDPLELGTDELTDWLARHEWAPETRRSACQSIRALYRWAHRTGRIDRDPAAILPAVRVPPGMPRPIPVSLFVDAVQAAPERTRLMLQLARFAGLRRAEISRVHTDDVDGDTLRVVGKGGRVREIPLHPVLSGQLRRVPPGWVFPSREGGHLTAGAVGKLMSAVLPRGWTRSEVDQWLAEREAEGRSA